MKRSIKQNLCGIEAWKQDKLENARIKFPLEKKYKVKEKKTGINMKELKQ